jgi:hypothetical protein
VTKITKTKTASHCAPEAASDGALAIKPLGKTQLKLTRISGAALFVVRRPYKMRGACAACEAIDADGTSLPAPGCQDIGSETHLEAPDKAVTHISTFGPRR